MRRLRAVCCLLPLACCLSPAAFADIQQPPRAHAKGERQLQRRVAAPATATPQNVEVAAGSPVPLTLHGEGQPGRSLEFQIRSQPLHGTISGEPTQVTRNSASILYVPTPGDDSTDDEFTFSVQVGGTAVSAPETVHLHLIPPPPTLVATPGELDFGAVKAGDSAQAEFTLENRGGSEADGYVQPPPPFVVDGPAAYHLAKGAQQTFRLIFQPKDGQVFSSGIHFRYETGGGVHLIGTGLVVPGQAVAKVTRTTVAPANLPPDAGADQSIPGLNVVSAIPPPAFTPAPASAEGGQKAQVAALAAPVPSRLDGPNTSQPSRPALADDTAIPVNDAAVKMVRVTAVGRSTVDLAWKPPIPRPAKYRVEVRYILVDDEDRARVDWRPYALAQVSAGKDEVTAHVRGLPPGGLQMLRVVAVDGAGRLAPPSAMTVVMMEQPSTWYKPTLLKVLVGLLLICAGLMVRKHWEDRQILEEIDASRRRHNAEADLAWKV